MTTRLHRYRCSREALIVLVSAAALILACTSCGRDTDAVMVDFSKTKIAERPTASPDATPTLQVAVSAMISPKETFIYYRELLSYIGTRIGRRVELIQKKTYTEINELFQKGQADLAFVCSGPYATAGEKCGFEILASPEVRGSHFYQAYLIVNKESSIDSLESLRGSIFAFTDPDSNTGRLVPVYWLYQMGERPETFFRKTVYTYSHDNSILAVGRGLVDGASVDGLIWDYYHESAPAFTGKTRIIRRSEDHGIPPLVVQERMPAVLKEQLRQQILTMHLEPRGQGILKKLMIDRFIWPNEQWYARIREMSRHLTSGR